MEKYTKVVFTDRPMKKPQGKEYTYHTPDFEIEVGTMVVIQAGSGYSIGQVTGFTDTITFDEKLAKNIVAWFEAE